MLFTQNYPSGFPLLINAPIVPCTYNPTTEPSTPTNGDYCITGVGSDVDLFVAKKYNGSTWENVNDEALIYNTSIGLFSKFEDRIVIQQARGEYYYGNIDVSTLSLPDGTLVLYGFSNEVILAYCIGVNQWITLQSDIISSYTFEDKQHNIFNTRLYNNSVANVLELYLAGYNDGTFYTEIEDPIDIQSPVEGKIYMININDPKFFQYINSTWIYIPFMVNSTNNINPAIYTGRPYIGDTPVPEQVDYDFAIYYANDNINLGVRSAHGRYYPNILIPANIPSPSNTMDYLVMISTGELYLWCIPGGGNTPEYVNINGLPNNDLEFGKSIFTFVDDYTGLTYTVDSNIIYVYNVCGRSVNVLPSTTPTQNKYFILYQNKPMYLNVDNSAWELIPVGPRSVFKTPQNTYLVKRDISDEFDELDVYTSEIINPADQFTQALLYKYIKRNFTSGSQNINLYEDSADVHQISLQYNENNQEYIIQENLGVPVVILDSTIVAEYPNNLEITQQSNGDLTINADNIQVGECFYGSIEYWIDGRKYTRSYIVSKQNLGIEKYNLTATLDSNAVITDTYGKTVDQPLVNSVDFPYTWGATGMGAGDFDNGVFTVPTSNMYDMTINIKYNIPSVVENNQNLGEFLLVVDNDLGNIRTFATLEQIDINYPTLEGEYPLRTGTVKMSVLSSLTQGSEVSIYYRSNNFDTPINLYYLDTYPTWSIQQV